MPLVTESIVAQLRQQIKDHGAVVWYDPQRHYQALAAGLQPADVGAAALHRYDPERGFLWLRRDLEPIWGETATPPRLLIYAPVDRRQAGHALIEFEVAAAVVGPAEQPPTHNTALAAVARRALHGVLPPAALDKIVGEVEAGQWRLAELDQEAERGIEAQAGVLKLIFGSGNATDVALRFLADAALDASLQIREALPTLAQFISDVLGVSFVPASAAGVLRSQMARQILLTDFILALGDATPPALRTFPLADRPAARQAAAGLAAAWRDRRDLAASYQDWARQIEREFGIAALTPPLDAIRQSETFRSVEAHLQMQAEEALARHPSKSLAAWIEKRLHGFWPAHDPEIKTRWQLIYSSARVLLEAKRVSDALKGKAGGAAHLLSSYAVGDAPWCLLDTAQRHFERDFDRFDANPGQHDALLRLVAGTRQDYAGAISALAEHFVHAYEEARFDLPGVLQQADIYKRRLMPAAQTGKAAYVLVDALRFEMAHELQAMLDESWNQQLTVALATPPTITEVGMAALMPGAEEGLAVMPAAANKLAAVVAGKTLVGRAERVAHFQDSVKGAVVTTLAELAPLRDKGLAQSLDQARVILVTATEEIDGICENTPTLARRLLDDALIQLKRGLNTLFGHGVHTAIITADHGYLFFGEKMSASEGIPAPGGQVAALKRRAWVGKGGAAQPGVMRKPLSAFGIGGDLELATPYNLAYFSVPGGSQVYFHGGLSLQEIAIPVLVVSAPPLSRSAAGGMEWELSLGSPRITTRFISITVKGKSEGLLAAEPPPVRAEVRTAQQVISTPVAASYGFRDAAKEVELRAKPDAPQETEPCTITLLIEDIPNVKAVTVHLLDANTGLSLQQIDNVPIQIVL